MQTRENAADKCTYSGHAGVQGKVKTRSQFKYRLKNGQRIKGGITGDLDRDNGISGVSVQVKGESEEVRPN